MLTSSRLKPVAGLIAILVIAGIVLVAVGLFRGSFTKTVAVQVISPRAGLVMNVDAKVKLHGAQVGTVSAIEFSSDGQAVLHLAMDPDQMGIIPSNVEVNIASSTVFGNKNVELIPPPNPSAQPLAEGQVLSTERVTVEINTIFEQLVTTLSAIEPAKLNETLGALSAGLTGRGEKFGQTIADLDGLLTQLDPSLGNLRHAMVIAPQVFDAYADAAPDLLSAVQSATRISQTIVDTQNDLDRLLISTIGLAEIGTDVVSTNRQPITDVMRLLVPTTDLTNEYNAALTCGLSGLVPLATGPPMPVPGTLLLQSFFLGTDRYRYPANLPKVAATGGPQCSSLPDVGFGGRPKTVVSDTGASRAEYGNQGILLNSDGLKQMLFGPIDGPPRNTAQIGQPG